MKKIAEFFQTLVAFIVQIFTWLVTLLNGAKDVFTSALKLAFPVFGFLIIWDCVFKPSTGILDNILSIFTKVGVGGQTLTTLLIIVGAVLILSYNKSVK